MFTVHEKNRRFWWQECIIWPLFAIWAVNLSWNFISIWVLYSGRWNFISTQKYQAENYVFSNAFDVIGLSYLFLMSSVDYLWAHFESILVNNVILYLSLSNSEWVKKLRKQKHAENSKKSIIFNPPGLSNRSIVITFAFVSKEFEVGAGLDGDSHGVFHLFLFFKSFH